MADHEAKLRELILYIAESSVADPDFGMTKLNKILFNADFTAFGRTGKAITGMEYQHLAFGPALRRMLPVIRQLEETGEVAVKVTTRGPHEQKRVIALREPNLNLFSAEEIALVDKSINIMQGMSAVRVSDLSHEFPGWRYTAEGETIPYETVFVSTRPLTPAEKRHPTSLAS